MENVVENAPVVVAQNATFDTTSIIQPFVPAMSNYWGPAQTFGSEIISGEITDNNIKEKVAAFNEALNSFYGPYKERYDKCENNESIEALKNIIASNLYRLSMDAIYNTCEFGG